MRVVLWFEFDGTDYAGFQRQKNAVTVQQLIEENLLKVTGEHIALIGAGRTDSGVHAKAFAAHFDTNATIPAEKYSYALNAGLPADIRVYDSYETDAGFHARFSAKSKHYRYIINNAPHASAVSGRFEYHYHGRLDEGAMGLAASMAVGQHDFACFMATGSKVKDTVREIYISDVHCQGDKIVYDVRGNGFLYNMVRIIVGTLVEIGAGKYPAQRMAEVLASRRRKMAGPTAPPQGLMLMDIEY